MKILNICPTSLRDKHGISSWFRYYFQGLIESDHQHELYFLSLTSVHSVDHHHGIEKEFNDKFFHFSIQWVWEQVEEVLNHQEWDVIHYHSTITTFKKVDFEIKFFNKILELKENGTKIITTNHSLQKQDNVYEYPLVDLPSQGALFYQTFGGYLESIHHNDMMGKLSDVNVYISENDRNVSQNLGDVYENTKVIYNSINIYKDYGSKDDYKRMNLAYCHRWAMRKNWMVLKELVMKNQDKSFYLSGDYFNPLVHAELMNNKNVSFHGILNESGMKEINEVCDVMLCPALYEPFGLTAIESVVWGTIPIIYKYTGTYEVLGDSSFYFDENTSIAECVENFYSTPNEQIKERLKEQQNHLSKFSKLSKMVDEYLSLYNEVVQ